MPSPWKHPATGMYWLRVDVPKSLQPILGVTSFKRTLGTKDPAEAKRRYHRARAEADARLNEARALLKLKQQAGVAEAVDCWFSRWGDDVHQRLDMDGTVLALRELIAGEIHRCKRDRPEVVAAWDRALDEQDPREALRAYGDEAADGYAVRLMDGSVYLPHRVGYPFLAIDGTETYRSRFAVFENNAASVGLVQGDLARAILQAEAWRAVDPEVELIAGSMDIDLSRPGARDQVARAYLERAAGHLRPGNVPKLREVFPLDWPSLPQPVQRVSPVVEASQKARTPSEQMTISAVFERWASRKGGSKVVAEWRLALDRWIELHGDTPIAAIKRAMVVEFRDTLAQLPARAAKSLKRQSLQEQIASAEADGLPTLSGASVKKSIACIRVLFKFARNELCLEELAELTNPAAEVSVDVNDDRIHRVAFTDEQAARIFAMPQMTDPNFGSDASRDADFWVMLLGATSGARLEELAAARPANIRKQDGIWGIFIERDSRAKRQADKREGKRPKRAKNENSYRVIPLHPLVVRAGFLRYVECRRRIGADWLFDLPEDKFGSRSSALSKRLNRMIDQAGMDDERLVFHSWRHTVKRRLRGGDNSDLVLDMLTGHAPRSEGDKYGGVEPAVLLSRCRQLIYRTVDWGPVLRAGRARARRDGLVPRRTPDQPD